MHDIAEAASASEGGQKASASCVWPKCKSNSMQACVAHADVLLTWVHKATACNIGAGAKVQQVLA